MGKVVSSMRHVPGQEFRVWGLGFRVRALGFRV